MRIALVAAFLLAWPAAGQAPSSTEHDPRFAFADVQGGRIVHVTTSVDTQQMLLFPQDDLIQTVGMSDMTAYRVEVAKSRDMITIQALQPSGAIIMSVRTDLRAYEIELLAQTASAVPPIVWVRDAPAATLSRSEDHKETTADDRNRYRLSGSEPLRPTSMTDDGHRTYIEWSGDQPLPATFAIDAVGNEQMVDGYMREGVFTIDRVNPEYVFRLDRQTARARRIELKRREAKPNG